MSTLKLAALFGSSALANIQTRHRNAVVHDDELLSNLHRSVRFMWLFGATSEAKRKCAPLGLSAGSVRGADCRLVH